MRFGRIYDIHYTIVMMQWMMMMTMMIHICKSFKASTAWDQSYEEIYIEMKGDMCGLAVGWC